MCARDSIAGPSPLSSAPAEGRSRARAWVQVVLVPTLVLALSAILALVCVVHTTAAGGLVPAGLLVLAIAGLAVAGARQRQRQLAAMETGKRDAAVASARMRATLDSALDTIAVIDAQGQIVDWGKQGQTMFGLGREQVVGKKLAEALGALQSDGHDLLGRALGAPLASSFEAVLWRQCGQPFPAEVSVAPLPEDLGAAVFVRDISDRKKTVSQLMEADRLDSLGRLVRGMAHELNNPLAFVTSNLSQLSRELSERQGLPPETREMLEETREGLRRVQRIVADLATFGREEAGAPRAFSLERPLELALQLAQPELRARKIEVVRRFSATAPVLANEGRLGQVFLGLLMNAAQAIAPGSARRQVVLTLEPAGPGRVRARIEDSGTGMSPEVCKQLFSPFFTTRRPGRGVGLSLFVARNIVSGAGGTITVESTLGQGSSFTVELPAAPSHPDPSPPGGVR